MIENKDLHANFLNCKIENLQTYHNHKEIMVNAGFIVQLTLFTTIIMESIWPPQWIEGKSLFSIMSTAIVFTAFWLLIHVFIVWQLQNKVIASLYINGYESALRKLVFTDLESIDFELLDQETTSCKSNMWKKLAYHILPSKKQSQKYDINTSGLPNYIAEEIANSLNKGTASKAHERLMVISSLLIWILIMIRMCASTLF